MNVYFAATLDGKYIKIGHSGDAIGRIKSLQRNPPYGPSQLVACIKGGTSLEKKIHKQFAHLRQDGEWFKNTEELQAFIDGLDHVIVKAKYMSVNVRLPVAVYRKLKLAAEETGMFAERIVRVAVEGYLCESKPRQEAHK